jgi:glycosyltransferase involved in cell wall biosynthesis
MTLFLHAPNVHQGGGRTLLQALLAAKTDMPCKAIVDARLDLPAMPSVEVAMRVPPTLGGRLAGELALRRLVKDADRVLCFGNLPPLLRVAGRVTLFLQNRYLLAPRALTAFGPRTRWRLRLERAWLRARIAQVADVVVQTPSMAREVHAELGMPARVLPFLPHEHAATGGAARRFDFLYVASGEPHKNHRPLVDAWRLLAEEGLRPSLCLTLGAGTPPGLLAWLDHEAREHGLHIVNVGALANAAKLYAEASALIYPSAFESFGLPILEAAAAGLPVLAPERDYVRDVVVPAQTFDPDSPVSIARAVKRHLGIAQPPLRPLDPEAFLRALAASSPSP